MGQIKMHGQKRGNDQADELRTDLTWKKKAQAQEDEDQLSDCKQRAQRAQNADRCGVVNGKTTDRKNTRRHDIIERRLVHFVALRGQRQGPTVLDVFNIGEMILRIEADVIWQQASVIPKQRQPE